MNNSIIPEENIRPVRFFHICTDGTHNNVIHIDDEDYRRDTTILAINAYKYGVRIICFEHMSSHSHVIVAADSYETAENFGEACKHDYGIHFSRKHGIRNPYSRINCHTKEIFDPFYLKRCIAYVLLNACTAKIVRSPEEYRWSSFAAYFNNVDDGIVEVASLSQARYRKLLKTKTDLRGSSIKLCKDGSLSLKSFVDYRFVEKLFGNQSQFFKSLALTNCVEEEELYVGKTVRYDDTELIAEVISRSLLKYNKTELRLLTKQEKLMLIPYVIKKTGASTKRLARILRLTAEEIDSVLGTTSTVTNQ